MFEMCSNAKFLIFVKCQTDDPNLFRLEHAIQKENEWLKNNKIYVFFHKYRKKKQSYKLRMYDVNEHKKIYKSCTFQDFKPIKKLLILQCDTNPFS